MQSFLYSLFDQSFLCNIITVVNFTEDSFEVHQEQNQSIQVTVSKGLEFAAAVVVKPKVAYPPAEDDTRKLYFGV